MSDFKKELESLNQDVENILEDSKVVKKRLHSGNKGHRSERALCKILTERFQKPFERAVGSGNRWGQVKSLPQHAKDTLLGDVCCPENFLWVLESKCGYEDKIDFTSIWSGNSTFDQFLDQADAESHRSGRKPMLLYKRNRRPWLAAVKNSDLPDNFSMDKVHLRYGEWVLMTLDFLLSNPDSLFFKI